MPLCIKSEFFKSTDFSIDGKYKHIISYSMNIFIAIIVIISGFLISDLISTIEASNIEKFSLFLAGLVVSFLFSFLTSWMFFVLLEFFMDFLRRQIPSKITYVTEDKKDYIVKHFEFFGIVKFYYNGLLHREKGAAVINNQLDYKIYYVFNKEVDKEINIPKTLKQHKVNNF